MSKKITAGNVRLKRAYKRSAAGDGTRILIDRLWPRGSRKQTLQSINGPRTSRPAQRCGNGSATIPLDGGNFAVATLWRSKSIQNNSPGYVGWQEKARSRSYIRHTTRFITTPLH